MSTKTQSALRATLKQEDAALKERLPEVSPPPTEQPATATPAASADTPVTPATTEAGTPLPVAPTSAAPAPAEPAAPAKAAAKAKAEKRTHQRFKLAASDRRRLGTLGDEIKAAGRRPSKSELVRAGIAALSARSTAEVMALVDTLSPAARAKDKKASRKKDKKAANKRKGKSANKKR